MNELEATRAKLKCLEMVEGTNLKWWEIIRDINSKYIYNFVPEFSSDLKYYEFALGVVEGKPVWKGDVLYRKDSGDPVSMNTVGFLAEFFSWNPPAPKTIMVELPVEVVEHTARLRPDISPALTEACRKALKSAKCK